MPSSLPPSKHVVGLPPDLANDGTAELLLEWGKELTRENYLQALHEPSPVPDPYPAELEAMLPARFQKGA